MSGAAVTSSHDHYRSLHTAAAMVDALLIAGLCAWRRAGWISLTVLAVDAGLGRFQGGPVTGTLHALLAALLFASVVAMAFETSASWQREPDLVRDYGRPSLRFLSSAAVFLIVVQIGFGAGLRHSAVGVMPHLLGALVVAIFIMIVGSVRDHAISEARVAGSAGGDVHGDHRDPGVFGDVGFFHADDEYVGVDGFSGHQRGACG